MADSLVGPRGRVGFAGHPYSSLLLPVPIVCFVGALLTDVAYVNSGGNLQWLNFSSWLLAAGLAFGGIAVVLALVDLARLRQLRGHWGWSAFGLLVASLVVEFINSLIHARDGWTAVVPTGLTLSAIGALLVLTCGWAWHQSRYAPVRP